MSDSARDAEGSSGQSPQMREPETPVSAPASDKEAVVLPEPVEAVLEQLPPPQREIVRESFAALLAVQGPATHPLMRKLTPDHVTKLIDGAAKDNERMYADKTESRGHERFLFVVGIVGFLALSGLFLWAQQARLLEEVVRMAAVFIGGFGSGAIIVLKRRSRH